MTNEIRPFSVVEWLYPLYFNIKAILDPVRLVVQQGLIFSLKLHEQKYILVVLSEHLKDLFYLVLVFTNLFVRTLYETHNLVRKVSLQRYGIELPESNVILFHSIPTCFFVGNDTNNDIY